MPQTEEDRIRRHYKSLKAVWHINGSGDMFLHMARVWKRPCKEIKEIVGVAERSRKRRAAQEAAITEEFKERKESIKSEELFKRYLQRCQNTQSN